MIENESIDSYRTVYSTNIMNEKLSPDGNKLKIQCKIHNRMLMSEPFQFSITRLDSYKNEKYEYEIKAILSVYFAETYNLKIGFNFNKAEKTFKFSFPENKHLENLTLVMDPELSQRLGFGLGGTVTEENAKGKKIIDSSDVKDSRKKAIALAYDTGIVVISDENSFSCSTVGIFERVMGNLYPTHDGQLKLSEYDVCHDPATMKVPHYMDDSDGFVKARFKLWRFDENKVLIPLVFKMGSYIQGNLKAI